MRKLLFFIAVLISVQAVAQNQNFVPSSSYGNKFNRGRFDSALFFPTFTGKPTTLRSSDQKLMALVGDSLTGKIYKYNPRTLAFADLLDSAFIRAVWVEATRELTLTRADGSQFKQVISGGGSGGSGATDFTLTRVDSILTETWNNGPSHSININDARIKQADINKWNTAIQLADLAAYLKKTDSTTIYASKYYNDTGKNRLSAAISTKIGIGTAAGGDLSGTYPNPTVAFFNGQAPAYYLNYNNLSNKISAGTMLSLTPVTNVLSFNPGGTSGQIVLGNATLGTEQDPKYIADTAKIVMTKITAIPGGADLNTYTSTGLYPQNGNSQAASGTNYPTPLAGMLEVHNNGAGTFIYQKYQTYNAVNTIYYRSFYNATWSPWVKVPIPTDYNTQDLASVLNQGNNGGVKDITIGDYTNATAAIYWSKRMLGGRGVSTTLTPTSFGSYSGGGFGFQDNANSANNKIIGLTDSHSYPIFTMGTDPTLYEVYTSKLKPFPLYQYADHIGSDIPQTADTLKGNTTTFSYNTGTTNAGTPYSGTVATFGGKSGNYQLQLSSNYISSQLSFRTKNSDLGTWNGWRTVQTVEAVSLQNTTNPVGANVTSNTMFITGGNNAPTTGQGLVLAAGGFPIAGIVQGFNYGTGVYNPLILRGANQSATANVLQLSTDFTYNGNTVIRTDNLAANESDPDYIADKPFISMQKVASIPGSVDLNTYTTTGQYYQQANASAASGTNYPAPYAGVLNVYNAGNGNTMYWQTYQTYPISGVNEMYFRAYYQGWSGWTKMTTSQNLNLQSVLDAGNSALATMQLGSQANTNGYQLTIARSFLGYGYTGQFAISGTDATNSGLNIIATGQGATTKTQYFILAPGTNAPLYSPDNNATKYIMFHSGNATMQAITDVGNTTNKLVQITGGNGATTTGQGLELAAGGFPIAGIVQGYNRATSVYNPLILRGANQSATANELKIQTDFTYNGNQVWYSGGTLQSNSPITLGAAGNTTSYPYNNSRMVGTDNYQNVMQISGIGTGNTGTIFTSQNVTQSKTQYLGIPADNTKPPYISKDATTALALLYQGNVTGSAGVTVTNTTTGINIAGPTITTPTLQQVIAAGNFATSPAEFAGAVTFHHIKTDYSGVRPTVSMASGASGTATLSTNGNDVSGTITVTLSGTLSTGANMVQLAYSSGAYSTVPTVIITPMQAPAYYLGSTSATGFTVTAGASSAAGTYKFNYLIIE